jgi:hypothetical protein
VAIREEVLRELAGEIAARVAEGPQEGERGAADLAG